jgi:hypothetical protein
VREVVVQSTTILTRLLDLGRHCQQTESRVCKGTYPCWSPRLLYHFDRVQSRVTAKKTDQFKMHHKSKEIFSAEQNFQNREHPVEMVQYSNSDQNIRLTSARRWLEEPNVNGARPCNWRLILDNINQDSVSFLREHLPHNNSSGNILLTTRTRDVAEAVAAVAGQQHQFVELLVPNLDHARSQLLKEAGIDSIHLASSNKDDAEALVKCIGRLPLAISHAASFAKQSHNRLNVVLNLYQGKHKYNVRFR